VSGLPNATSAWKRVSLPLFTALPACHGAEPEQFFCDDGGRVDGPEVAAARAVCERCPVIGECLDWALRHDVHGVWGGTTRTERTRRRNP
jgi:WhiB family redox-sensing transcriptional regulator